MKNKQTTLSLEASQAIASLGIECESEKWWMKNPFNGTIFISREHETFDPSWRIAKTMNLQELLALLPAIGEKLGWFKKEEYTVWIKIRRIRHYLLDTYFTHGMEGCSREIIRLIKE